MPPKAKVTKEMIVDAGAEITKEEKIYARFLDYVGNVRGNEPMKEMGLLYIRFAAEEPKLFRCLFQPDAGWENGITELMGEKQMEPVYESLCRTAQAGRKQAERILEAFLMYVHGYASMIVNNMTQYDEEIVLADVSRAYKGMVYAFGKGGARTLVTGYVRREKIRKNTKI